MKTTTLVLTGLLAGLSHSAGKESEESFAQYLPADCAVFFEAFREKEISANDLGDLLPKPKLTPEAEAQLLEEKAPRDKADFDKEPSNLGRHLVVAMGGEANALMAESGKMVQELSAILSGAQVKVLLNVAALLEEGEASPTDTLQNYDPTQALAGIDKFELGFFFDSLLKDDRLALPSTYVAIRPDKETSDYMWAEAAKSLAEQSADPDAEMEAVPPVDGKWPRRGMKTKQDATLAASLREWWENASEQERGPIDEKRFEKLEKALSSFRFTVMWAQVEGWFVFYLGNGPEGFQLQEDAATSLASDGKLQDLTKLHAQGEGWMRWRVSKEVLKGLPNWLNDAPSYQAQALAFAEHTELKYQGQMTEALYEIAKNRTLLSRRKVEDDWYGVGWMENGLRIETRGGMRNPGLDYDTEWEMTGGADSAGGFMKAQWVANRSREKWSMKQTEAMLSLLTAALAEWVPEELGMPAGFLEKDLPGWMEAMTSNAQAMTLDGLGGEAVLAVDLQGEMPQLPDLSGDMLEHGRIPRVLLARAVKDREVVRESGEKMLTASQNFWEKTEAEMGADFPFPGIMSSEEHGLKTSFVLIPFSNDDFVPNVNLGEDVLIYSSSRTQAKLFQLGRKSPKAKPSTGQSGLLIEFDLRKGADYLKLWDRLTDSAVLPLGQADMMLEEFGLEQDETVREQMGKLRKIRYHHREEEGELRSSFTFEVAR